MPKEIIYSPIAPEPIGPYSQAIKSGNLLFVSGQIALSNGTRLQANIKDETPR